MKYTEEQKDEIKKVAIDIYKNPKSLGAEAYARDLVAALTARKLRDDCPVMYDTPHIKNAIGFIPLAVGDRTNVRPLLTKDEVLELIGKCFGHRDMALYFHEFRDAMQAAIDAHKYEGESNG